MFSAEIRKTKEFVKKHKTLTACAATAVVTQAVTRKRMMGQVTTFIYEKGYENGTLRAVASEAFDFIDKKGLMEEFAKNAPGEWTFSN
jgi:hypothetical protein